MKYPSDLHERFRLYGRDAGFTNSVFERYFVVQKGISNDVLKGEIIVLGAKPYVNEAAKLVRIAVIRSGPGYEGWSFNEFEEDQIQQSFKQAQIAVPQPELVTSPPIVPQAFEQRISLASRVRKFFQDLAYYYGPGRFFWLPMMLLCLGLPLLIAVALFVWFFRRSRRD